MATWQELSDRSWQAGAGGAALGVSLADQPEVSELDLSEVEQTPLLPALLGALARLLAGAAGAAPGCAPLLAPLAGLAAEAAAGLAARVRSAAAMTDVEVSEAVAALRALPELLDASLAAGVVAPAEALRALGAVAAVAGGPEATGATDGRVVGAAAEAMCALARRLLLHNIDPCAALGASWEQEAGGGGGGSAMAAAALGALAARLQQLLAPGARSPSTGALRTGALLAAAALLGAQQPQPGGGPPPAEGPHLLSSPATLPAAKQLLRALEGAAMAVGGDTRCAEVRGGVRGGSRRLALVLCCGGCTELQHLGSTCRAPPRLRRPRRWPAGRWLRPATAAASWATWPARATPWRRRPAARAAARHPR